MNGGFFLVILALLAVMWLLLIRPQRRRQVAQQQMLGGIQVGDEIVTAGGIYGSVREVRDDEVVVEIAPGTSVRLAKRAIATVIPPEEEPSEAEEPAEETELHPPPDS